MGLTSTHTSALLEVSPAAFDEIAGILKEAGYDHVFMHDGTIDMHGIALERGKRLPAGSVMAEGTLVGEPEPIRSRMTLIDPLGWNDEKGD